MRDGFSDEESRDMDVPVQELNKREGQTMRLLLGGDRVLDLECLLNGFTNRLRGGGVNDRVAGVEEGGSGGRVSS